MPIETEGIEFKEKFTEDIYKEVIAFANTSGGIIYVGIDDNGEIVDLGDINNEYTRITNGIRDAIQPDITMFVRFTIQDDKIVCITVNEGTNKPYYLKSKGIKPSGVYVRQGTSSAPASYEQIRQMIKESDGDTFEEERSIEQELTFKAAKETFLLYGVSFSKEKYRTLGITHKKDNLYTNLALLLSDQCTHTTKIAVFADEACTIFRDTKEFGGSVFHQFKQTINYLSLCNKTSAVITGIVRTEKKDYPDEAIREAFLNALVHRDYSFSGSIILNVTDKQIEFISLGGLLPGLSPDDIRSGISQPRNKNLASVFHRLRLIESYGTGIRRIFNLYSGCMVQPQIQVTSNTFKITLPNMNAVNTHQTPRTELTPQMQKVLDFILQHKEITDEQVQQLLGIKKTRSFVVMKQMENAGLIKITGRGQEKRYTINL